MISSRLLPPALLATLLSACIIVPVPVSVAQKWPLAVTLDGSVAEARANTPPAPLTQPACPRPASAAAFESQVLAALNAERRKAGLAPITASARLRAVAQDHACHNARRQSISHTGRGGSSMSGRMKAGGYRGAAMAENTGLGFVGAPERMVAYWMASPGHRANLLSRKLTEAGLGFAAAPAGGRPAWVLNMGRPR